MVEFVEVAQRAARAGGQVLLDWQGRFQVREKGPSDLVTEADLASQNAIRSVILASFPNHDVLGEEDQAPTERTSPYRWIVDPLDGTTNYVHRVPHYCVSVALEKEGQVQSGCIYDPISRECFTASRGGGAYLNGKTIRASGTTELAQALIAVGFPAKVQPGSREITDLGQILTHCQAVRRTGSAALNLAYVACGRFDAYWARETKAWDVAAGLLLVQEAGGVITGFDGGPPRLDKPRYVACGTAALHEEVMRIAYDAGLA
ncbi:MAG: inositol monophosphatase family protein [Pirellulales bacterium]|nr:inositol monophosphatase family protein [Pirellulales bacterium]